MCVGVFGDVDSDCVVGEQVFDLLRPLNQADGSAVEVVFCSEFDGLGLRFQSVAVEVVDEFGGGV